MHSDVMGRYALHLAAIVESSDDAIVSKDLSGIITSWNRAAVRLFGYEPSEAIGRSIRMLIPAERQQEEDEVLARIRAGKTVDHFETVRVRKDGSRLDISLTVSPIRDRDGTIVGASKIARDITERKRIQAELAAADAHNRLLAETGATLGTALDHRQMLRTMAHLVVPDFADVCTIDLNEQDGTREHYSSGEAACPAGEEVIRTGTSILLPSVISVPLRVRTSVLGAITFSRTRPGREYTQRDLRFAEALVSRVALAVENARAYEQAREANRLKDEFLATLSHELRTPLNAILGYTRMLRTRAVAAERRDAALETVERNAIALTQIVNDVLDISRVVRGNLIMRMQSVPLSRLVEDAVATVLPAATAKGVQIRTHVTSDIQTIVADPDRMQQVLWNLLSNAVKFTPRGGRITVEGCRAHGDVDIVVTDTGEGIPKDFLPFVFERFRQADTRMAGVRSGLGIGLAIARHIVEMHGGTIEAASEGTGKGASFRVRLPVAVADAETAPAARR